MKNVSTKSIILAPFNSTKSKISSFGSSVKDLMYMKNDNFKFAAKCREVDRQYEA
jgi:hypothetical protein